MYKKDQSVRKIKERQTERGKSADTQRKRERSAGKQDRKQIDHGTPAGKQDRKQIDHGTPAGKQDRKQICHGTLAGKPNDRDSREEMNSVHTSDSGGLSITEKETWRPGNMLYPLPAVMVSCAREGERPNIITVAWAGTVCTNPPMVSISVRPSRYSYEIIKETGEFVINLVTEELVHACDWCGVRSGRDHDKFAQCHLDAVPGEQMKWAPLIAQSPVNIECRVKQILPLGSHSMFLAEVVSVHADTAGMDESGRYDLGRAGLITYSHGEYYALGKKLGTFGYSVKKKSSKKKKARN